MTTHKRLLGTAVAAAGMATAFLTGTAGADNGGRPFNLEMSGAQEFNNLGQPSNVHGDADRGSIKLTVNPGQEELCFSIGPLTLTSGDSLPVAAHIHVAPAGIAGPIVIHMFGGATAPTSYPTGTTCVSADRALLVDIIQEPSAYYVNLHNVPHGGGVMRAQLG